MPDSPNPDKVIPSLDEIIERTIGGFGWEKLVQIFLIAMARIFHAQQTFISIYADAEPTWHCTDHATCNSTSNICKLSKSSWAWDGSCDSSIISEWGLECRGSFITGLPASNFFIGCLLGGFALTTLADSWLGRKKLLFLSCLTMSLTSLITIFSTNVWVYSGLKFVCGFSRASIGTCALVLLTEIVGKRWRGHVGNIAFLMFTLGYLSLPAIAYTSRLSPWRNLYLWTSIPALVYSGLVLFFVYESPRWLLLQGRGEEAMAILEKFGPEKNHSSSNLVPFLVSTMTFKEEKNLNSGFYSSIKSLFTKRWAFRRTSVVMVLGFGIGMVYYGISLGVGNLGFNIYVSVMLNALMEIPSYFITVWLIEKCARKSSVLATCMISGICSIMCGIVGSREKGIEMGMELASFFCALIAYNVLLIFSTELFPTSVRNWATSMVRQSQVFGAVFSPILISAGRKIQFLSYGVFGLVVMCCGFFVVCLPETKGVNLCDTMDEQESNESQNEDIVV